MRKGKLTDATITSVEKNEDNSIRIQYAFKYCDEEYHGDFSSFIFLNNLIAKPGSIISIYFEPRNPNASVWKYQ